MSKTRVILTGATGLVGSRFVELYGDQFNISNLDLATGVDITDNNQVEAFLVSHPADTLIHLAAFTDTAKALAESGDKNGLCYRVNVIGTQNIANACRKKQIHLAHISTDFVFDGNKAAPYVETDSVHPLEWYGQTKALAEKVVQTSEVNYTILRLSYPYRAYFDAKPDLITKIRQGLASGKLYPQFSDTIITPTFVDDIARAFAKIVETKLGGIFHIAGSSSLSPYELARKVAVVYGFDPSLVKEGSLTEYSKSTARPFARHVAMCNTKAIEQLGLTFVDIDTGLTTIKNQQQQ